MNLDRRLREIPVPDAEEASARARRVVLAAAPDAATAHATLPAPARRRPWRVVAVAAAAIAVGVAVATPPGEAVGHWVKGLITHERPTPPPRPALTALPGAGRLLVTSPAGAWVVQRDGSRRRIGPYQDATWSPHGLFVAATRGRQLLAVEPGGAVRWAIARPQPVSDPRWSSEGFRIAYSTAGTTRVVAGDGTADRLLARGTAAIPATWRPGPEHHVTIARNDGAIETWNADARTRRWRLGPGPLPLAMRWTPDGRRLIVVRPDRVVTLSATARVVESVRLTEPATTAAISADGRHVAVAGPAGVRVLKGPSVPVAAESLTWSPTGRRLLIATGDEWVFLPVGRPGRVSATANIARHFDPSHRTPRGAAHVEGWAP